MTITTIKAKAKILGSENFIEGYIIYDGTKGYCVPQTATLQLTDKVLTTSASVEEIDPATVQFINLSEILEEKTVRSGAKAQVINPATGKSGFSKITVEKVEGGETEGGYSIGDYAYIDVPFAYKSSLPAPEYEITDTDGKIYHCYKAKMVDAGNYMGALIEYKNGKKGIIILLNEILGKCFHKKIEA